MAEMEPKATWQAGSTKDARGRSVKQLDPVMMHLLHQHGVIPAEPLRAIAQRIGIGMTRVNRLAFWSGVLGFVCLAIAVVILLVRLNNGTIGTKRFFVSLLPYCGVCVAPFSAWMGMRGARFQRTRRVMLEHERCPHCGYDLRGLAAEAADGATVCPECGCAWNVKQHVAG
jgi:hypothetical protein